MPNPNDAPPPPKSVLDAMNEMLDRYCDASADHFPGRLGCCRSKGHEGPHYDAMSKVEWTSQPSSPPPKEE